MLFIEHQTRLPQDKGIRIEMQQQRFLQKLHNIIVALKILFFYIALIN